MSGPSESLLLLETLRLGVVPHSGASAYTVGRDEILEMVEHDLAACRAGDGATRCWLGGYGAGKTHLLELVEQRAIADGFLVTSAVLDPNETAPSHPRRVYSSLIQSLKNSADGAHGLQPLLVEGARSPEACQRFGVDAAGVTKFEPESGQHLYLTPALRWTRTLLEETDELSSDDALDILTQWISGFPSALTAEVNAALRQAAPNQGHLYSLKDYRPWARIYGYLLSGIDVLARTLGYSGLVVLLDEAEFYSLLSADDQSFAQTLFQALSYAASGGDDRLPFLREELDLGGSGVLKELPPRYGEGSSLYVVFAMTPHAAGLDALKQALPASTIVDLPPLERRDYDELVSRVADVFTRARPSAELPDGLIGPLARVVRGLLQTGLVENPRQAIKFLVQFLELADQRADDLPIVFRTLREQLPV